MLIVISPAKTLDYDSPLATKKRSQPAFLNEAEALVNELRELAPHDISKLMSVSDKLGTLNFDRYQQWSRPFSATNARQAVLAFKGDVYTGMAAENFSDEDFTYAQDHLRILSGLYGLLRPLDLMQPYRLEMGTRFANAGGNNLYAFWDEKITRALNKAIAKSGSKVLVNLASNEYFKAVVPAVLDAELVTPVFKEKKGDNYKVVSFLAKKARGVMSAWIIHNRVDEPADIKKFRKDGYRYNKAMSTPTEWVFTRDQG